MNALNPLSASPLCIPILKSTLDETFAAYDKAAALKPAYIEVRVDGLEGEVVTLCQCLPETIERHGIPTILTYRSAAHGGHPAATSEMRHEFIKNLPEKLVETCHLIDLEFDFMKGADEEDIGRIPYEKRLCSHHDTDSTPPYQELKRLMVEIDHQAAAVSKLATTVKAPQDLISLLRVLKDSRRSKETIVVGMGPLGLLLRIFGPKLGSHLTFVALEQGAESAPGQCTHTEFKELSNLLDRML
jgi:3-dehydroquinate dehydratase / shikimate dehydrogenase